MTRVRWIFTLVALLVSVACSDNPAEGVGQGGTLTLRLTTPNADDGAMTFEVSGAPIESITVVDGSLRLFTRRINVSTIDGAVVGSLNNGVLVTLHVPDVTAGYTAMVLEVADREDALRPSLDGYVLTVTR
jgi:hypothetical protein